MTGQDQDLFRSHFLERFRHDWWANTSLLTFLEGQTVAARTATFETGFHRACHLLGHLLATELLWLGRVEESGDRTLPVWRRRSASELAELLDRSRSKWRAFLDTLMSEDFGRVVSYRNTMGQHYENTLIQIIAHVLNHSTHHRAQILSVLRELDLEPPGLDYVVYLRLPQSDK